MRRKRIAVQIALESLQFSSEETEELQSRLKQVVQPSDQPADTQIFSPKPITVRGVEYDPANVLDADELKGMGVSAASKFQEQEELL